MHARQLDIRSGRERMYKGAKCAGSVCIERKCKGGDQTDVQGQATCVQYFALNGRAVDVNAHIYVRAYRYAYKLHRKQLGSC